MYSQTMAARFDCKKLLRFALATLCLLALAMLMPVAARAEKDAEQGENETANWTIHEGDASVSFKRKGSADEDETNTGHAYLEVYVLQNDSTTKQLEETKLGETKDFEYQYNSNIDTDLYDHYDNASNSFKKELEGKKDKKHGAGVGGYASLDLGVNVSQGYTLYKVDYTVCYSSEGPKNTGWKTKADFTGDSVSGPTQYYYLDNITDGTTVKVYIMPTYTIQYEVKHGDDVIDANDYSTYFTVSSGNLARVTGYPQNGVASVSSCAKLKGEDTPEEKGMTENNYTENEANNPDGKPIRTPKIYPYHRWCTEVNEKEAVDIAKNAFDYTTTTSVTPPTLTANSNYKVSKWSISGDTSNNTYNGGREINVATLAPFAIHKDNNDRVITLTAVVTDNKPENTDNSGNGGDSGNTGDSGSTGGDSGNTGSGDNNGGQESTPTPAPETTPASTPSVTTVTAVAPTATPTATPAPTAEPTATPAPAAVSAHIPQTSDDMPYTLLVVTALASLCAAGALFMKRRSK